MKERIKNLFVNYEPAIQSLIAEVLLLEQEHISMDKPHLKDQIDQIISRAARKALEQTETDKNSRADK